MSNGSDRASEETQTTGYGGAKGIANVLLVATVVGMMAGVIFFGLMECFPALVLPHGGWEHVNWNPLGELALKGGAVGLALGAFIIVVRRVF